MYFTLITMGFAKLPQYGVLQVTGEDARAFLHAQLTNDIEHLASAQSRYAGWCSAKGRLLATFLVVPCAGGFLLQVSRDLVAAVAKRLSMFILRSRVKIADATDQWVQLGLWGPGAVEQLAALGVQAPGGELAVGEARGAIAVRIEAQRFLVLAGADLGDRLPPEGTDDEWTLAEVRAGRPLIVMATQDQFVPQMVNLELAGGVDFRKGCYPGQEIVARAQYRGAVKRRMYRLRGGPLRSGQELFCDVAPGEASGTVVNAAGGEALAVLQVAAVESGLPIRVQPHGAVLEPLSLPYAS